MPSAKGLRESPARNQGSQTIPFPLTSTESIPYPPSLIPAPSHLLVYDKKQSKNLPSQNNLPL